MEASDSEDGLSDMPTRPMRVKVLYTFDADSKINCLARFADTLQIPVVQIDENAHVGVIALHKCLQQIVSASPELITHSTANDFAIYAYDYSETDTPLVGQGMLSSALHTAMNDLSHASGPMITGRVCQNVPAIFSNGVKETLEVKLRLAPVAGPVRLEKKSMDIPRTNTPATSAGFDPNAWNNSMQNIRPSQGVDDLFSFDDLATPEDDQTLLDMLALAGPQDLHDVGIAETPTDSILGGGPAFAAHAHSAPGSRVGSPNLNSDYGSRNKQLRHQSFSVNSRTADQLRPGSRGSVRSEYHQAQQDPSEQTAFTPNYEEFQDEDGQARKRAKITQTDWRGKSSFGGRSSDLRVTAATAASMQMHRPIPKRAFAPGSNLEPPPRVPTPVPRGNAAPGKRPLLGSRSMLRQASTLTSDFMSDAEQMSDAIVSSPDDDSPGASADGTPQDIPSSPPVFPGLMQTHSRSPRQSAADSGYMSERNLDSMDRCGQLTAGSESCSPEFQPDLTAARPFIKREDSSMPEHGYPVGPPMSDVYDGDLPEADYFSNQHFSRNHEQRLNCQPQPFSQLSSRANSPLPNLAPAQSKGARLNSSARRSSLALPTIARPSLSNTTNAPSQLQRSQSHYVDSEAGSPAPSESGRPNGPGRSGSGAPRRRIIEQRLHKSVAKGEMPQFCSHCGAIETPTWRRLYVKYVDGKPSPLDFVEGEGETIGVEELEYDDETGDVSKFVIRKSMKKTKNFQPGKGFKDTQICNSCGLWFTKMRMMRPQNKWGRKSGTRKSRKKTANEMTDGMEPTSEACFTDAIGPEDDQQLEQVDSNTSQGTGRGSSGNRSSTEAQQHRRRISDGAPAKQSTRANADLDRMTRSSPVKLDGTQESPIELDDRTPKPTRRLLFPSPRQEGETKTLDNSNLAIRSSGSKPAAKFPEKVDAQDTNVSVYGAFRLDKENMPPLAEDDDFSHLLTGSPSLFKTPQKSSLRRSPRTNKLLNSASLTSPTPSSRKRKQMSLGRAAQAQVKNSTNDFITSPASSRYFLRSTPTRLAVTPGRHSQNNDSRSGSGSHDVSPFSRQLAEMLTNDTSMIYNSPTQAFAFSDLPAFTSPGGQPINWDDLEQFMSGDFAELDAVNGHATSNV